MKFVYRFVLHLLILLLVSLPLQLLGIIVLAIVCPIIGDKPLPKILRWFDNADQYIGRDTSTYLAVRASGWFNNYCWLALRNPCNYFGYVVLGTLIKNSIPIIYENSTTFFNNTNPSSLDSVGDVSYSGSQITDIELLPYNEQIYEYYYVYRYKYISSLFNTPLCLRVRIGYKIGDPNKLTIGEYIQQVFVVSPLHSFTGIS
jgi:hypothetical protein